MNSIGAYNTENIISTPTKRLKLFYCLICEEIYSLTIMKELEIRFSVYNGKQVNNIVKTVIY